MEQWDSYFPPLNLWNYSLFYEWTNEFNLQNSSDGPDGFRQREIVETATR